MLKNGFKSTFKRAFFRGGAALIICCLFLVAAAGCEVSDPNGDRITQLLSFPNPVAVQDGESATLRFVYQNNSGSAFDLTYYIYIYNSLDQPVVLQTRTVNVNTGNNTVDLSWNGHDDDGNRVAPGVYLLKLVTEGGSSSIASLTETFQIAVQ